LSIDYDNYDILCETMVLSRPWHRQVNMNALIV